MASILTSAIIVNAKSSVSTYVTTAQALYDELSSLIGTLKASSMAVVTVVGLNS